MKNCSRCKVSEPKAVFEGTRKVCNSCRNQLQKYREGYVERNREKSNEWRKANPEKTKEINRRAQLKRVYGITPEDYDSLLEKQGFACAVCHRPSSEFPRRLAVDHDHQSKRIRGLLCTNCNHRVVGRHRDPKLLRAAADYLEQSITDFMVPEKKKRRRKKR